MSSPLRQPLIAGNWKMNLSLGEAKALAVAVKEGVGGSHAEVALCVPFTSLALVGSVLQDGSVRLGAQDLHWEPSGAFTGEISAPMLRDAGCRVVIIGHSERRRLFGDTDETVRKKLAAALKAGLVPIVCVGETLEERENQSTYRILGQQIKGALDNFAPAELAPLVLAYEPVWAIGTGKTATPDQAQEAHAFIRKTCDALYPGGFAAGARILYGGSVKAENVDALMAQPDLDGALVGGESLKPVSFLRIVHFRAAAVK